MLERKYKTETVKVGQSSISFGVDYNSTGQYLEDVASTTWKLNATLITAHN